MIKNENQHQVFERLHQCEVLLEKYELAKKYNLYLYSDEIYSRVVFSDQKSFYSPSINDHCKERVIVANGFSKAYAMTGWRLGVAIGPAELIEKMSLLLQTTVSCVSPFLQQAGIEAIEGDQSAIIAMISEYEERRDLLVKGLNDIPGINCLMPGGALYVFPNIKETGLTSEEFARYILEEAHVGLLPGTHFGDSGKNFVRLCFATSEDHIKKGLQRIKAAVLKLKQESSP